jgi:hypothetical protein
MRYFLVLLIALFLPTALPAQVHVSLGINLGLQPAWGPTGYDHVEYYYMPDIEAYYYVPSHRFYFYEGGNWVGRTSLPTRYRDYDLYNSYKIVLNERTPWRNHKSYRGKYASYKGRSGQHVIRDSRDSKYFVSKGHPEHNNWVKQQKGNNGNSGKRGGNDGNYRKQNSRSNDNGGGRQSGNGNGNRGGGKNGKGRK